MGYDPNRELEEAGSDPRRVKQQNLYYPVDHEEFSHLLTSIN